MSHVHVKRGLDAAEDRFKTFGVGVAALGATLGALGAISAAEFQAEIDKAIKEELAKPENQRALKMSEQNKDLERLAFKACGRVYPESLTEWKHLALSLGVNLNQDLAGAVHDIVAELKRLHTGREQASNRAENQSIDARALACFIENPAWKKKDIALEIGCHEKSLSPRRCPKLAAAIAAYKSRIDPGNVTRGAKDKNGNLEAWDEE